MAPRVRYPLPNLVGAYQQSLLTLPQWPPIPRYETREGRQQLINRLWSNERGWRTYVSHQRGTWNDVLEFAKNITYYEDQTEEDMKWEFDNILGAGAFGLVGLWLKKNGEGLEIDRLAIKQTEMSGSTNAVKVEVGTHAVGHTVEIPEEAVIQAALQQKNCRSVLQLRTLKSVGWSTLRYYLEYCPYGDLSGMIWLYWKHNKDNDDENKQIPEAFLWQLLLGFAEAMRTMQDSPFDHPFNDKLAGDPFVLHLDIKPGNIFVSDPEDEDIITGYPACKVGDWGLAALTSLHDRRNSAHWKFRGTRKWQPPEQYDRGQFGSLWRLITPPPPWTDGQGWDDYDHKYTTAHTVFAFGQTMFALMALDQHSKIIDEGLKQANEQEDRVQEVQYRWFREADLETNILGKQTHYSKELKAIVIDCLHLDPSKRPSATRIHETALQQCNALAAIQNDPRSQKDPVFDTLRYGVSGRGNFFSPMNDK